MAKRNILDDRDGTLRKKSRNVTVFDSRLHQLLDDMAETMESVNGVGLAAVQVGVLRRVFIADAGEGIIEFINPKIIKRSKERINDSEGCLSFPGQYGMVERPKSVTIEAQDRNGDLFKMSGEGLLARAMCHETDHLDGVIFLDLATEMLDNIEDDDAGDEGKAE